MGERTLIKGGTVLSMDPEVGDHRQADVLVEDGAIAAVGPDLEGEGASEIDASGMVVMPGLVDSHRHYWYTAVRALMFSLGWEEVVDIGWVRVGATIQPEDVYYSTRGGIADALNAGITSSIDYFHAANSRAHAEESLRAHSESPLRLVFGYGPSITKKLEEFEGKSSGYEDWDHAAELAAAFAADPRRDLALALSGPDTTTIAETAHDIRSAREIGIPVSIHTAFREGAMTGGVKRVAEQDLLGPDLQFVHCCATSAEEFKEMAAAGAKGCWTPQAEVAIGLGIPPTRRAAEEGVDPAFGCDAVIAASGDLFDEARAGLLADRMSRALDRYAQYRPTAYASELGITARQALEAITINAARSIWIDDRVGSLTPGKRADVIMLRGTDLNLAPLNDVVETVVAAAHSGNVDTVMIDGDVVKRDGELLGYDREQIAAELRTTAERVFERAGHQGRSPA